MIYGIATGEAVGAVLALGAAGVSVGTRFLASEESRYVTGLTLYVDAGFLTRVP